MEISRVPIGFVFISSIIFVMISIELGYLLGRRVHVGSPEEKESPVSSLAGAVLALTAFMLAFTFGIASSRFDARKELVREDANAIRTMYLRSDLMPAPENAEAKRLLREYLEVRLTLAKLESVQETSELLPQIAMIQHQLWELVTEYIREYGSSDVNALIVDSMNEIIEIHAVRVAVGLQARIPLGMWIILCSLTAFGMAGIGYQTGIAGSKRSKARPVLAIAFALVIVLIAELDRPDGGYIRVTQQPLIDLQTWIVEQDEAAGASEALPG